MYFYSYLYDPCTDIGLLELNFLGAVGQCYDRGPRRIAPLFIGHLLCGQRCFCGLEVCAPVTRVPHKREAGLSVPVQGAVCTLNRRACQHALRTQ